MNIFKPHRSRVTYWSSSKPIVWVRKKLGLTTPYALTVKEWNEFNSACKKKHPILHYLTSRFVNNLQKWIMYPSDVLHNIKWFYSNWKGNHHVLTGGFKRGEWVDLAERINRCLLHELERFVEQEKGMEHLLWEISLVHNEDYGVSPEDEEYGTPTPQALAAQEQLAIYNWWKANKDFDYFKDSGLEAWYDKHKDVDIKPDEEYKFLAKKAAALEDKHKQEEEDMLIRLIRIRNYLWT